MFWRKKEETPPKKTVLHIHTVGGTHVVDPKERPVLLVSFVKKDGSTEDITQKTPLTDTRFAISASDIYDALMPLAERFKDWTAMEVMYENGDRFFVMRSMFTGASVLKIDPTYDVY